MLFVCSKIVEFSNIKIRINTNGLSDLINNRNTAKEFWRLADTISISLNASSKEEYDKICHSKFGIKAFDSIINFANEVKNYVPNVYMSIVNTSGNQAEIEKCQELCNKIGVKLRIREYIK